MVIPKVYHLEPIPWIKKFYNLKSQQLATDFLFFIFGTNKERRCNNKRKKEWVVYNARNFTWINNCVDPLIGMHLVNLSLLIKDVCIYLANLYCQSNFAKRYELENTIRSTSQKDRSVQSFYNFMKVAFGYLDLDLDFKSIDFKCLDSKFIDFKISYLNPFIQRRMLASRFMFLEITF